MMMTTTTTILFVLITLFGQGYAINVTFRCNDDNIKGCGISRVINMEDITDRGLCYLYRAEDIDEYQKKEPTLFYDTLSSVNSWDKDDVIGANFFKRCGEFTIPKEQPKLGTNLDSLFEGGTPIGDISWWDVSEVTSMKSMFAHTSFNGNLSEWVLDKVVNMDSMFAYSSFDGDVSKWDVSSVVNFDSMFSHTPFSGNVSEWKTGSATSMDFMFSHSYFDGDVSKWNVSKVTSIGNMFSYSLFDGDVSGWNISNVKTSKDFVSYTPFTCKDIKVNDRRLKFDIPDKIYNGFKTPGCYPKVFNIGTQKQALMNFIRTYQNISRRSYERIAYLEDKLNHITITSLQDEIVSHRAIIREKNGVIAALQDEVSSNNLISTIVSLGVATGPIIISYFGVTGVNGYYFVIATLVIGITYLMNKRRS